MTAEVRTLVDATESALLAARRLDLRIEELTTAPAHHAAAVVLQRVWRADSPDAVMNASTMTALAYAGNYVVGVYRGGTLIGAAVAFFGTGHLHSHVAGVDPRAGARGAGFALKQHQRAWALARDIDEVCWTFDPLVVRNAYLNLHKLGAAATAYLPDFYGLLADGINLGDPSDRLYVRWRLSSAMAAAAAAGHPTGVDLADVRAAGALPLVDRDGDRPRVVSTGIPNDGRALLVAAPVDIEALRGRDPAASANWRRAVRDGLSGALAAGYRIAGMAREGFYVLVPGEQA